MNIGKRIITGTAVTVLTTTLVSLALLIALRATLGSENYVKTTLREHNTYQQLVSATVGSTDPKNSVAPEQRAKLSDVEVRGLTEAIEKALPPEFLQSTSEQIIDSVWQWSRDGNSPAPQLHIDVSKQRADLVNQLNIYFANHANSLPVCADPGQFQQATDPLTADCRPPITFSPADFTAKTNEMLNRITFLQDGVISGNEVVPPNSPTELRHRPLGTLQSNILISVVLALLAGAAAIWASTSRTRGLKVVAWALIGTAILTALSSLATWGLTGLVASATVEGNAQRLLSLLVPLLTTVGHDMARWQLYIAIVYALLGFLLLMVSLKLPKPTTLVVPLASITPAAGPPNSFAGPEVDETEGN